MKDVNVENVSLIIFKLNENTNEKFNSSMLRIPCNYDYFTLWF